MAMYLYNDVLLPEIPADVLAEYPYAWIRKHTTNNQYQLLLAAYPWYYKEGGMYCSGGESATEPWYNITISTADTATEWTFNKDATGFFSVADDRHIMWSNHDIPNGSANSTEIFFYGSEPVDPNAPEEPEEVYYKISGERLTAIADAIRKAAGLTRELKPHEMVYWLNKIVCIPQGHANSTLSIIDIIFDESMATGTLPEVVHGTTSNTIYINKLNFEASATASLQEE